MQAQLNMGAKAVDALRDMLDQDRIISVLTDKPALSDDRAFDWCVQVRTFKGFMVEFYMAGYALDSVRWLVEPSGRRLIDTHNPLAVLESLEGPEILALNTVVLAALAQTYPEFAHLK
jgi:hypothetical protein